MAASPESVTVWSTGSGPTRRPYRPSAVRTQVVMATRPRYEVHEGQQCRHDDSGRETEGYQFVTGIHLIAGSAAFSSSLHNRIAD